jgi:hypothetical protein
MAGNRFLAVIAMAILVYGVAEASPASVAKKNVELFDELVRCSKQPGFQKGGLGQGGPCAGWVSRIEAQQAHDRELIQGGFLCLAGDIRLAGTSLVSGDREHFAWVKESVNECRAATN